MAEVEEKTEKVVEQLKTIYDPEIPIDIVELGLIYDITFEEFVLVSALENAVGFKGKANPKALIGKCMPRFPDMKQNMGEYMQKLNIIVEQVNSMDLKVQEEKLLDLKPNFNHNFLAAILTIADSSFIRFLSNPSWTLGCLDNFSMSGTPLARESAVLSRARMAICFSSWDM